jgi:hypothetical protein
MRGLAGVSGAAFVLFGLPDLVEMRTGTWFSPWWLLLWKVSCVVVLGASYLWYRQTSKAPPDR